MAFAGNTNQPPPFDLQNFFKTPNPSSQNPINLNSSPFHIPSSYPPPPAYHHQYHHHHHHLPPPPHMPYTQEHQRSLSYPTPPLQPLPPNTSNENHGARLMALLSGGQTSNNLDLLPQSGAPVHPPFSAVSEFPGVLGYPEIAPLGPFRTRISKVPTGRYLVDEYTVYDIDDRLEGQVQPQLEVIPITKYGSDPQLVLGRQIAVNKLYICYGLKQGNIRVLNTKTALRSLLRGHTQRVTDMAFFAEDVHLLASVSIDGMVYVWKISEGPDEEDNPQVTGKIVIAIQIVGEEASLHPRICWHCHKQEVLVVGIGKSVLRIDITKIGKGEVNAVEEPLKISVDKLIDGVQLVGKHDGEVTDLSMCQWMTTRLVSASMDGAIKIWDDRKALPLVILRAHEGQPVNSAMFLTAPNRPDHIVLITAGPLNREVKIWALASEEGWMQPSDAESWKCTQTLELKSSAEPRVEEAFFNQAVALSQAGLLLLANAKKNAIYSVHVEYGPNPTATRMDYIQEFTVTMPILSFTGTCSMLPHWDVQVYCIQTHAIQQYALDISQCLPLPLKNVGLEKSEFSVSSDATSAEGFSALDTCGGKLNDLPLAGSSIKPTVQGSSSESAAAVRYPVTSAFMEVAASQELTNSYMESKPATLAPITTDAENVSVGALPFPLSSRLSQKLSGFRSPTNGFEPASPVGDHGREQLVDGYSVDLQVDTIQTKLSDVTSLDGDSKSYERNIALDTVLNPPITFKHPTHLITPTEILIATSSSKTANAIEGKSEGETSIQEVVVNNDVGSAEVEVKVVGQPEFAQNDELFPQGEPETFVSDNKDKFFCSQDSDLGIRMAKESCATSTETFITEEAWQADGARITEQLVQSFHVGDEETHDSTKDFAENSESTTLQIVTQSTPPHAKGKKQKGKNSQVSGPSSPFPSALNSTDCSNEPGGSSSFPTPAAVRQIQAMQEKINQLMTMQKEMQKQMTSMVAVPVTKEGKRIEAALGRSMEKSIKANTDALWTRFQEENAKNERTLRDCTQQITNVVSNFLNKDLPAMLDKTVKKEIAAVGNAVGFTISSTIEKTIPSIIAESFQRGVGDKAVNQLDKSVNNKLEVTVARQIQAQFQTSGKHVLQDALKSSFEASVIPAFEMSCKTMFEQVDSTFQKGIIEHTTVARQHFDSAHSSLALALREVISSASSLVQTLSGELADGQRNLLALAAGANPSSVNPLVTQLSNGPLGGLHEKVETPLDPRKELLKLISEQKYEEAFTGALQRSDVSIVSWLCSQVDLHRILTMDPLPLSQGVVLSLLQQLACDINQNTSQKLAWMKDVAAAINPMDSMIALHVRPIFEQVYQILSHQRSFPTNTGAERSSIHLLLHVINSMLMTCK